MFFVQQIKSRADAGCTMKLKSKDICKTLSFSVDFCVFFVQQIKSIADAGCTLIVSGGKVGELAQHYCNKYKIMVVRLLSKWDLRRLCRAVQATALPRVVSVPLTLHTPQPNPLLLLCSCWLTSVQRKNAQAPVILAAFFLYKAHMFFSSNVDFPNAPGQATEVCNCIYM